MGTKKPKSIYILHGWAVDQHNRDKWLPLLDLLAKKGIKAKFLAIPGLTAPLDEVWGLQDYVDWLGAELPKKGAVNLLGHSFGGQISIRYAAQNPERVSQFVLVDSAGIRDHSVKAVLKRRVFWLAAKVGKVFFRFDAARSILYKLARERDYQNAPPLLRRTMSTILDDEVVADLPLVKAQTLLIWGADDMVTPLKTARLKERLIENANLEVINGARHSPQFTHTEQVADLVSNFFT